MTDTKTQQQTISRSSRREITAAELIGDSKELTIIHNDERYVIRITANNKLILTK